MKKTLCLLLAVLLTHGLFPVSASAQSATVQADGGTDRFGTWRGNSTYAVGDSFADSFYYTDGWFLTDPAQRNDALALLSIQLTAAIVDAAARQHSDLVSHSRHRRLHRDAHSTGPSSTVRTINISSDPIMQAKRK